MMLKKLLLVLLLLPGGLPAQDQVLLAVSPRLKLDGLRTTDVSLALVETTGGYRLRVQSGTQSPWPGFQVAAPEKWDLSAYQYIETEIENPGRRWLRVSMRIDNPGKNRRCRLTGGVAVPPNGKAVLRVPLRRYRAGAPKLFGMRGYPPGCWIENGIQPAEIVRLVIFVNQPTQSYTFTIGDIRATGVYRKSAVEQMSAREFFPFVDAFGQYLHRDWPGRIHSLADLRRRREQEEKELKAHPGPAQWDKYGGWADGPQLEAAGHFYTVRHGGKWWLVDPAGRLFFSHGITCVRAGCSTPITGRDSWFQKLPPRTGAAGRFYFTQKFVNQGYYKGTTPLCFDFGKHNLLLKYGADWETIFLQLAHRRLRSWGMNTLGLWSATAVCESGRTPYVTWVHYWPQTLKGKARHWKKFHDVFDPATWESLRQRARKFLAGPATDPYCIGVFVDNELAWGEETTIAETTIASPPEQKAKQVFVDELKRKYKDVAALNRAWGTSFNSWEALLENRNPVGRRAHADLKAFTDKTIEVYFQQVRSIIKEFAPNKLYLGCRFNGDFPHAAKIAANYCDVVSYNLYRRDVSNFTVAGGFDKPAIIGEWHFGAADRGLFAGGLREVASQRERGRVYEEYARGVLKNPFFVGCHWFQYSDEMVTGRPLDCENYQIGFVDVADTPYRETVDAARRIGYNLYKLRTARD